MNKNVIVIKQPTVTAFVISNSNVTTSEAARSSLILMEQSTIFIKVEQPQSHSR